MKSCLFDATKSAPAVPNANETSDTISKEARENDVGVVEVASNTRNDKQQVSTNIPQAFGVNNTNSNIAAVATDSVAAVTSCPFCHKSLKKSNSLSSHFLTCKQKKQSQENITSGGSKKKIPRNRNSQKKLQEILNNHYSLEKENLSNVSAIFGGNASYVSDFDSVIMSETVPIISNHQLQSKPVVLNDLGATLPIATTNTKLIPTSSSVHNNTPMAATTATTTNNPNGFSASGKTTSGNTAKVWR